MHWLQRRLKHTIILGNPLARRAGFALFALFALFAAAQGHGATEGGNFLDDPAANKYALILVGASVNDEYANKFAGWAKTLRETLQSGYGYDADKITLLLGDGKATGIDHEGACRLDNIREAFDGLAAKVKAADQLTVVMFGHGTGAGEAAKFNIVGPDITGAEFGELLSRVKTQNIIVANTTSASHDFSRALAAPGRVIVSATRSAAEKYDTVFPGYFVDAFTSRNADRDKNQRVSALEAFQYASSQVEGYFKERGILASEHATMDDNGDGIFSVKPSLRGDGQLAEVAYFDLLRSGAGNLSATATELKARMANLEREVIMLRAKKNEFGEREYWSRLENLLVELAKATRDFNAQIN